MRSTIRFGGVLRCDAHRCDHSFVTYSVAPLVRQQASNAGWVRVAGSLVAWPSGSSPMKKRVDLCPEHSSMVASAADLKAHKLKQKADAKAEKLKLRADAKAEKLKLKAEKIKQKADARAQRIARINERLDNKNNRKPRASRKSRT
jgi:hypothetical protein